VCGATRLLLLVSLLPPLRDVWQAKRRWLVVAELQQTGELARRVVHRPPSVVRRGARHQETPMPKYLLPVHDAME
jgi:hypothetical protein